MGYNLHFTAILFGLDCSTRISHTAEALVSLCQFSPRRAIYNFISMVLKFGMLCDYPIVCTVLMRNSFLSSPFSIRPCCQQATQSFGFNRQHNHLVLYTTVLEKTLRKKNIKFCLNLLSINFLIIFFIKYTVSTMSG